MPELILPTPRVRASYLEACREYRADQHVSGVSRFHATLDLPALDDPRAFTLFCRALSARVLPYQHAPSGARVSVWWWCDGAQYLGEATVRDDLTDPSRPAGSPVERFGHLGFMLRPTARGRGLGRPLLAAALRRAHQAGVDPVVLTVAPDNTASVKTIEGCGGVRLACDSSGSSGHLWLYLASGQQ